MAATGLVIFKMDVSQRLWISTFCLLMMKSSLTYGERYTRVQGVKYEVPGSWTGDCRNKVSCTALYCATGCTCKTNCRSFSYSKAHEQCVFNPWYFDPDSGQGLADSLWSTYTKHSRECDSQPCQNGGTCSDVITGGVTCTCGNGYTGNLCETQPVTNHHCKDLMDHGQTTSGVYTVYPDDVTPVSVYCDQDTGGGGWVVFQRRQDNSQDFDLSLESYKDGFGDMSAEFWFGLDKMRMFTTRWTHNLRVEMGSSRSNTKSAVYSNFNMDSDYKLNYDAFTGGDAGDCFQNQKGYAFSTPPIGDTSFCAPLYYGGWWYANSCMYCNLNARYGATNGGGIKWHTNGGSGTSHSWTEMKIRPA